MEELRRNAREALHAHINALRGTGQTVPPPAVAVEEVAIDVA
jgi:predicted RNase H-like HicB family nuclease